MSTYVADLYYQRAGAFLIYGDHNHQPHGFKHWSEEAEANLVAKGYKLEEPKEASV